VNAMEREQFLAWSRQDFYTRLVGTTLATMRSIMVGHANVNIAVSGGKDSLVMLDLALQVKPGCFVWHWDYGIYMPREIEREVIGILAKFPIQPGRLILHARQSKNAASLAGYRAFFAAITGHLRENHVTLNFIGLRSEESIARKRRCKTMFEQNGTVTNAFPLRDWRWKDVWAYIVQYGITYPSAYDAKARLLGWDKARFVTFFDPEFEHLGGMAQDKFLFWRSRDP